MTLPRIGILGGMGPAATILLQQRVLEAVPARSDDDHIPLLIDMNPQVPSRISYLIHNRGQNPGPVLAKMARGLEASGVDAIAMPCCTAHLFAAEISSAVTVPFLNMVRLTAAEIARRVPNGARIGILASPATEKTGLYESALSPHDLQPLFPKGASQMLSAIEAIKSKGPCPASIATVQEAIHELSQEGVAAFIVGCSEFSLMSRSLKANAPIVDALDVLTKSITDMCAVSVEADA